MADNVAITAGSGTTIATDEVAVNGGSTAHVQYVKLVDGAGNGTDGVPGTTSGLYVLTHRDTLFAQTTSAGLTTAAIAYTAGDQVGTLFTIASAARASGGGGYIRGVVLHDEQDIIGPYDVVFFRSSVTLASDNAAFTLSDSDANLSCGLVQLTGAYDIGANRIAQAQNLAIPYTCTGGTSLYAALICRAGHTFFSGGVGSLKLDVWLERD